MKALRAKFAKSTHNDTPAPSAPTRTSTIDSINRQFEAFGLDAGPSRRGSQEPPAYSETPEPGFVSLESGSMSLPSYGSKSDEITSANSLPHLAVDAKQDEQLAEEQLLDAVTAFAEGPSVPTGSKDPIPQVTFDRESFPKLTKPVLVPRVHPGPTMPFVRAWAPTLSSHAITQSEFLAFLDGLNLVCAPHAAIRLLELAALGIGFVPIDWANGLSSGLNGLAQLSAAGIAHARKKRYLARLNDSYFRPRGLHARVVGTRAMRRVLGIGKEEPLILPLDEESADLSVQERCLRQLENWAAELEVRDLPPPDLGRTTWVTKVAAWQVRSKTGKFEKQARQSRRRSMKRVAKGKKLRENGIEKLRVRMVSWVLVQDLEEYEREMEEERQKKQAKKDGRIIN